MTKESKIKAISLIILIGFVSGVINHYIKGFYFGQGYPYNTFLFKPSDSFNDFFYWFIHSATINPYLQISSLTFFLAPFPLLFLIGFVLNLIFLNPWHALIFYTLMFFIPFVYINFRNLSSGDTVSTITNVFIFSCLTFPVLFNLDRGSIEGILLILMYLFLFLYRKKKYFYSSLLLAIVTAIKPFSIVFLLLFLSDKKFKSALFTLFITLLLIAGPLVIFQGGFWSNLIRWLQNLGQYTKLYSINIEGLAFNSSIYGAAKVIIYYFYGLGNINIIKGLYNIYLLTAVILVSTLSIFVIVFEKEFWKKVTLMTIMMTLFPPVSADYRLIHLFLPLYLFVNSQKREKFDPYYVLLFGLLFIPKNYFRFSFLPPEVNIGVILDPLLMIFFIMLILKSKKRLVSARVTK